MRVYYYYQFVYKLVYYNNKTNSANPAATATGSTTCQPPRQCALSSSNIVGQDRPWTTICLQIACRNAFQGIVGDALVEKPRHIHRIVCAERGHFCFARKLSTFRSNFTQALFSR